MKVSLYEAHKLVKRISKQIDEGIELYTSLNVFSEIDREMWLLNAQASTANSISVLHRLIDARSNVRRLVQELNESSDINKVVADERRILDQIEISSFVVREGSNQPIVDATTVARQAASYANGDSMMRSTLNVFTVPIEVQESESANLKGFNRQLDEVRSSLVSLNHSTFVQLDSDLVEFLKELDIV